MQNNLYSQGNVIKLTLDALHAVSRCIQKLLSDQVWYQSVAIGYHYDTEIIISLTRGSDKENVHKYGSIERMLRHVLIRSTKSFQLGLTVHMYT